MNRVLQWLRITLVGLLMGAAEVVPGVSGGTIAFVSGYYQRLLRAIGECTPMTLLALPGAGLAATWRRVDGSFLLALFGAMLVSVFLLAGLIGYLLDNWQIGLWGFFFGLVAASVWVVGRRLRGLMLLIVLPHLVVSAALGALLSLMVPMEIEASPLALFFGASLAVCAWILPGISGSFILLLLGLYPAVLQAIREAQLLNLAYVAAGCALGLVAFARLVAYLLARHQHGTLAVLTGFMLGSLVKIWPWRVTLSYQLDAYGGQVPVQQLPVLPGVYAETTGGEPLTALAVAAALAGAAAILLLDRFAPKDGLPGRDGEERNNESAA